MYRTAVNYGTVSDRDIITKSSGSAFVSAVDNCPVITLDFDEESTQEKSGCGQYDYQIVRTWTATDQCGNATNHVQTISVVDEAAPDIFRVHTLPNGKKMVAGVME